MNKSCKNFLVAWSYVFFLCATAPTVVAQNDFSEQVNDLIKRYEKLDGQLILEGGEELRKRTESNFSMIKQSLEQIGSLQREVETADAESRKLKFEIEKLQESKVDSVGQTNRSTAELESDLLKIQGEIERRNSRLQNLENLKKQRAESKSQFQNKIEKNNTRLGEIEAELSSITGLVESNKELWKIEKESELLLLQITNAFLRIQFQAIEADQKFELTVQRLNLLMIELSQKRDIEAILINQINIRKQKQAAEQAQDASAAAEKVADKYPWLASSESINVELANQIRDASKVLADEELLKTQLERQNSELLQQFRKTKSRIEDRGRTAARSTSVGAILRKLKAELPNEKERLQEVVESRQIVEDLLFTRLEIENRSENLSKNVIKTELENAGVNSINTKLNSNANQIDDLIQRRKDYLSEFRQVLDDRIEIQFRIENANLGIARTVNNFNSYINERILWIRSNKLLFSEWLLDRNDRDLVNQSKLGELVPIVRNRIQSNLGYFLTLAGLFAGLVAFRSRLRRRVDELGEIARRGSCSTFWPTAWSSILSILIAVTIPLLIAGFGWGLSQNVPSNSKLYDAISQSLLLAGLFSLPFEILRRICRPEGLAICHFDWAEDSVSKLQKELSWFILPASASVFVISVFVAIGKTHRADLIERTIYIAALLLSVYLLYRVFNPSYGIFSQYLKRNQTSWANQTSYIWLAGILFLPMLLAGLAFVGYYYTALKLTRYLVITFALALGVEFVRALVRRFVLVRRRYAHIEKAKRQREAEIAAEKEALFKAAAERKRRLEAGEKVDETNTPVMTSDSMAELQFDTIDIDQNAGQANQLIKLFATGAWILGLWVIWSDVLPALKALDEFTLWGQPVAIAESETIPPVSSIADPELEDSASSDAASPVQANEKFSDSFAIDGDVSLRDLILFIAIVLVTFFASRNLPNAVEMLFLDELPVDQSTRFATKSLFSYAIIVVGVVLGLRTLSIDWASIQWLVTALTFGLAFGLQEIFANFVAGIILMFERPMRIGDLITVDDFTGVVTRIRTRATTVVNWDRKEYVIPNKDFITGRLVNWTLSDAINRIQFTVGIAYGSDVDKAKKIIFEICNNHDSIVDEPPTSITFEEFADSSLNLVLRTFLGEVDSRLVVIDDLHTKINEAFNEAGIEIAFPQRDLHVRSFENTLPTEFVKPN